MGVGGVGWRVTVDVILEDLISEIVKTEYNLFI